MIVGIGIDLVEIARIKKSYERYGLTFARRILTESELAVIPGANPAQFLAARFAAKEAAVKALGTGFAGGITLKDIAVKSLASGQPELILSGKAKERANELLATRMHLTLTHSRDTAGAVVILEK
ncbi:holo-[acyl-carrier-protein] synthase [Desulfovibrio sp. OttesenSCG-928-F07]|nr:holo-[acyl-carrier-protein] synthase [Desulfovibrio sp. OttesenSCG-928-F07]